MITDVSGKQYMDFLSAYSALNFEHRHPALIAAAYEALDTLTLTSRVMRNDQLGQFPSDLCEASGIEMALSSNTGTPTHWRAPSAAASARRGDLGVYHLICLEVSNDSGGPHG